MRTLTFSVSVVLLTMTAAMASVGVSGLLFHKGQDADGVVVTLQRLDGGRIRVFDRQVAYRNEQKACVRFALPTDLPLDGLPLRLDLEAYNDDPLYLRSLWFEVDGIGGYLAVQRVEEGQYRGSGTIGPRKRKRWVLPLNELAISIGGKADSTVNFDGVLRQPGPHTICAWISTYAQYGPKSWVTLDLVGGHEAGDSDMLPSHKSLLHPATAPCPDNFERRIKLSSIRASAV